jgi:hypothetical protein
LQAVSARQLPAQHTSRLLMIWGATHAVW